MYFWSKSLFCIKFSKKHILKLRLKVVAWIARRYYLEKGSLSAHSSWKPPQRQATPSLLHRFPFSLTGGLLLFPVHAVQSSPQRVAGRGGPYHSWLISSLPLSPILCVCSSDCLLSFLPVEFSKARISLPLATRRAHCIFDVWNIKQILGLTVQKSSQTKEDYGHAENTKDMGLGNYPSSQRRGCFTSPVHPWEIGSGALSRICSEPSAPSHPGWWPCQARSLLLLTFSWVIGCIALASSQADTWAVS